MAADFPVLDKNAKPIALNGKSGSGIRIRAWEVSALHAMTKSEWVIPLSSVEKILRAISEDESVPWAEVLLDGVRNAANSNDESARLWAHLIAEFGKAQVGQNILDPQIAIDQVVLSGMQYQFMLRRLANEFLFASKKLTGFNVPKAPNDMMRVALSSDRPQLLAQSTAPDIPSECQFPNDDIQANAEWAMGRYWDEVYKIIGKAQKIGGKLARFVPIASQMLDAAEAGILAGAMRVEFRLEGEPLVRTKTVAPGESRPLWLTVSNDTGKAEYINCTKIVTTSGILTHQIRMSVPENGPLANADVQWSGQWGFQANQWVSLPESNSRDSFPNPLGPGALGPGRVDGKTERLNFPTSSMLMNGPTSPTNVQGRTYVVVQGRAQKENLPNDAQKVVRQAIVWVQVKPSKQNVSDVDAVREMLKDRSPAGALTTLVQTGLMTNWLHKFNVIDWEDEYDVSIEVETISQSSFSKHSWSKQVKKIAKGSILLRRQKDGSYEGRDGQLNRLTQYVDVREVPASSNGI